MLRCRVKRKDRTESVKYFFSSKKEFKLGDHTYKIVPTCVYNTQILGLFNCRAIDYVEGNPDPVDFYSFRPVTKKSYDTINTLVKSWMLSDKLMNLINYLLIGIGLAAGASIVSIIILFQIAENLGVW